MGWGDVPEDLLFMLAQRLVGLANYIRFGTVCRSWHSLVPSKEQIFAAGYIEVPWLMITEDVETDVRELVDISTGEVYKLSLPILCGRSCSGSSHGWLVTLGLDLEFHVLNPFTGVQKALPPHSTIQSLDKKFYKICTTPNKIRDAFMSKATLSSDPAIGEYVVMATHVVSSFQGISFCKSHDKEWTTIGIHDSREIAFVRGKFYSVSCRGKVYACEISPEPKLIEIASLPLLEPHCYDFYFMECGEELLVVAVFLDYMHWEDYARCRRTADCRVFKLQDLDGRSLPTNIGERDTGERGIVAFDVRGRADSLGVVVVEDISNHALLLGPINSICLPIPSSIKSWQPNCFYLAQDYLDGITYKIRDGEDDPIVFNTDYSNNGRYCPKAYSSRPLWITPNPW